MVDTIATILESFGHVQWPYKTKHLDWFTEAKAYRLSGFNKHRKDTPYVVEVESSHEFFATAKEAATVFVEKVFVPKNLGLAYVGIWTYNLNNGKDFDDLPPGEVERMCDIYIKEYFYKDYPFAK